MDGAGSAIASSPEPRPYLPENSHFSRYLHQFHLSVEQNSSTNRRGRDDRNFEEPPPRSAPFLHLSVEIDLCAITCVQRLWEQARDNVADW
jgi:hypothetical protein